MFVYILIIWMPLFFRTVYRIVEEKESRAKEGLRMAGLSDLAYWASWFTYFTVVSTLLSLQTWYIFTRYIMPLSEPMPFLLVLLAFG